jgi:hypothetical protein
MWLPTKAQVDAASRHAISIAGTAIVIFGLQAKGLTVEQVTAAINSLGDTVNSVVVLLAAVAPLYALLKAGHSASPAVQIQTVKDIATGTGSPVAVDAQKALISATAAVAQDKSIPASTEAKAALIDAVAAQQEVVGDIKVTDQAVVDATTSPQVKKAS